MLDWLYDNRTWLFEGIGVVILVAVVTALSRLVWRLLRRKSPTDSPAQSSPPPGVVVEDVRARALEIDGVRAPGAGVGVSASRFKEDVTIRDVEVGATPTEAQPGSPASGAGATLQNVSAGGGISVQTTQVIHLPPDATQAKVDDLRRAYLTHLYDEANALVLTGVDREVASKASTSMQLNAVYTALLTQTLEAEDDGARRSSRETMAIERAGERPRLLSVVAMLNRSNRLVLLGDPGSGKSTFVSFVAVCLAGEALGFAQANLALLTEPLPQDDEERSAARSRNETPQPQPWDHGALLPVRVILRDFAARGLPAPGVKSGADHLWRFIEAELHSANLADFAPHLRNELMRSGGLLLLDGLDEVPEADQRRVQIKQAVEDFARTFGRCRILVTSRTYAYQQQEWRLPGFTETLLEPFSSGQMRAFIDRWYAHVALIRHMDADDAQGRAELLKRAIFNNDRLFALAERPLLLTLMASLHAWRSGNLPERRVELYADAVELLLDWWESQRVVRNAAGQTVVIQPSLSEALKVGHSGILTRLNELAYAAHASQPALVGTADIGEKELVAALLSITENRDVKPLLLVEYLRDRAGLLTPRGVKVYTFPHRTFQEYLAACHLTGENFPETVAELARRDPNRWREVALLAGAKAAGGTASALWSLVDALCYRSPGDAGYGVEDDWGALLAGQALTETADLPNVSERNRPKLAKVRAGLIHALRGTVLPAVERALAGRTLAALGDERPEIADPMQMRFCYVAPGPFWMGEGREQYQHDLSYGYWISQYPVTNAHYRAFMAAGGYGEARYWPEAGKHGYWKNGRYRDRNAPYNYGEPFTLANHPVMGVAWFEALAFTRWLTERFRTAGCLASGWVVHLPNEPEWEKAARGGLQVAQHPLIAVATGLVQTLSGQIVQTANPQPRRAFPWGEQPNGEAANCTESKIGSPSAVGCFRAGASPYGVEELGGNVWEWTRSLWDNESGKQFTLPYRAEDGREHLDAKLEAWRVLRGGAYYFEASGVGCGARDGDDIEVGSFGFRVVASPLAVGR